MNDRDIPVYLSPANIALLREALEQHARNHRDHDVERAAYGLAEYLVEQLDQYRTEIRQMRGRRRKRSGLGATYND